MTTILLTIYLTGLIVCLIMLLAWDLDTNENQQWKAVETSIVWPWAIYKLVKMLYNEYR